MFEEYMRERVDDYSDREDVLFFEESVKLLGTGVKKVVDLGCGVGRGAKFFKSCQWHGLTYNILEAENYKKIGAEHHIHVGDMHESSQIFGLKYFDAFIMWDSLEHCISPYVALKEAYKILRRGGRGLVFMPGENWTECKVHIHVMNARQMCHLFNITGFKVLESIPKKYPAGSNFEDHACEGMAVYLVEKDLVHKPAFTF
jgi:SAM-dependent methyltransferase